MKRRTLKILGALALFARLANNFDGATRENTDNSFRSIVRSWRRDFDKRFHLLLLLVDVGDKELLADAASYVGGSSRRVAHVDGLAVCGRPFDSSFLRRRFARDGHHDSRRTWPRIFASADNVVPPGVPNHNSSWWWAKESLFCAVRLLCHLARHYNNGPLAERKPITRTHVLSQDRAAMTVRTIVRKKGVKLTE